MTPSIKTLLKPAVAAVLASGVLLAGMAGPASAARPWWFHGHHAFHRYYQPHYYRPYYYYPRYQPYYYGYDPGAAVAGSLIGGIFGAIAGTALSHAGGGSHIWRCEHHYRTYQRSTNTYMGYDGYRHVCRL